MSRPQIAFWMQFDSSNHLHGFHMWYFQLLIKLATDLGNALDMVHPCLCHWWILMSKPHISPGHIALSSQSYICQWTLKVMP